MRIEFRDSFAKDLKVVKDKFLLKKVKAIIEAIEQADSITQLPNVKKLRGHQNYFRMRIGDYRIGIALKGESVILVRLLNRKDVYKYFP